VDFDPYEHDPARWGASLSQNAELLLACLDAAGARSVVEVGAFAGDLTRVLVDWAARADARVGAIDPAPQPALVQLAERHPQLELIRETSRAALPRIDLPDAIVIDGDHNWWTVSEELRLIAARGMPLLLFHDVCWPHARRDDYFDPEQIPADARHPIAGEGTGIFPGEPGVRRDGGLPYPRSAAHEGGPRNGVLTAIEDFVAARDGLRLAVVPAFFGFGAVWHRDAAYAGTLAEILDPLDRNPVLERLEENRVYHLASVHKQMVRAAQLEQKLARQEELLRKLLESKTFSLAIGMSRLRQGGEPAYSKDEVRRALAG
jgi:methyltransferase family protein